jgi:ABC-type lipoprotein release transport system permease subunit
MTILALIQLSWKNVWRNKVRSSVVIISVILATWSSVFLMAFYNGMTLQFVRDQLVNYISHIQIHDPRYVDESIPSYVINNDISVLESLRQLPFVEIATPRTVVQGLASSASGNYGVSIQGVYPELETSTTNIHEYLVEGDYFETSGRNPVIIGQELANRLQVQLRSRIVLTFQDTTGTITAGAFRVTGILKTPNSAFNEQNILVRAPDLQQLIGAPGGVHEIVILVDDFTKTGIYAQQIDSVLGHQLSVRTWGQVSPVLQYVDSNMDVSMYTIVVIIIIALCFSIINTMLMAVLERTHELGMLQAIGLDKPRTFAMIMLETLFLTMVGAPFGFLLSWGFIEYFGVHGIDLSMFSKGLEMYGFDSIIYTELHLSYFINLTLIMLVATLISAVYPALKVLKLQAVQAMRNV